MSKKTPENQEHLEPINIPSTWSLQRLIREIESGSLQSGQTGKKIVVRHGTSSWLITLQPLNGSITKSKSSSPLSDRELQVLQLLAKGASASTIGEHLNISPDTVRTHRRNLRRKLGITERSVRSLFMYQEWWDRLSQSAAGE
jgi:DNA-binding CsgD family transcriptional regulator